VTRKGEMNIYPNEPWNEIGVAPTIKRFKNERDAYFKCNHSVTTAFKNPPTRPNKTKDMVTGILPKKKVRYLIYQGSPQLLRKHLCSTLNQLAEGSSPSRPTTSIKRLRMMPVTFFVTKPFSSFSEPV
jgi:hypothetical protein